MAFEVNFSSSSTPADNTVTLYNLSKTHQDFFKKDEKCCLYFNWGTSKKLICEGYISKVGIGQSDGVNTTMTLTFTEGTDYSNVVARTLKVSKKVQRNRYKTVAVTTPGKYVRKREHYYSINKKGKRVGHYRYHTVYVKPKTKKKRIKTRVTATTTVNLAFRKGKTYRQIIQGVASQANIKIARIDLAKNPIVKKAYTAKGKPLSLLARLAKECDSVLTYERGKLVIVNPKAKKTSWVEIDGKDLVSPPAYSEDDSGGSSGSWEITMPLIPEITTFSGIKIKSQWLSGQFYVVAGQHTFDGNSPQTVCTIKNYK
ncbi:hypothetical protein LOB10_02205 [Lactobacillus delbrueckii subsp. lactis]|uniref:hypothetical protein n=1 Tax=Lactobacillus delbrueckii TaxID=1584 RepID=UPI001E4FEFAF|nr:hypothetical protein [Lactobacillus delbrueckii]MCD5528902.1 hypothetical protein [Lactobacillus delbrueckii subsp. lactis]